MKTEAWYMYSVQHKDRDSHSWTKIGIFFSYQMANGNNVSTLQMYFHRSVQILSVHTSKIVSIQWVNQIYISLQAYSGWLILNFFFHEIMSIHIWNPSDISGTMAYIGWNLCIWKYRPLNVTSLLFGVYYHFYIPDHVLG